MSEDYKDCWAKLHCNGYKRSEDNCHKYCIGFNQLNVIYKLSNMPKKYQRDIPLSPQVLDRDSYIHLRDEWLNKISERVKNGESLLITSERKGNGKTTWATKIMNEYFRKVALRNNMVCRGLFINTAEFFQNMKDSFDNSTSTYEFKEFTEHIKTADLVIWDDIGVESPTGFVKEQLYLYINYRYSNELAQIFTSNLDIDRLAEHLGDRVASRVINASDVVEFKGEIDRRGRP